MWILEKEASSIWCPMSRVLLGSVAVNRSTYDIDSGCRGRKCALWRWGHLIALKPGEKGLTAEEVGANPAKYPDNTQFKARKGYCGMGELPHG